MEIFQIILLIFLLVCALAVCFTKDNLTSVVIFMSYSVIMSVIWILLKAPDLAITEAAVGAGVTSVLFFLTLKKINQINSDLNTLKDKKTEKKKKEKIENQVTKVAVQEIEPANEVVPSQETKIKEGDSNE